MRHCEQDLSGDGLWEIIMQNRHDCLSIPAAAGGGISGIVDRRSGRNRSLAVAPQS